MYGLWVRKLLELNITDFEERAKILFIIISALEENKDKYSNNYKEEKKRYIAVIRNILK